jgi:hypothetical protein
LSGGNSGGELVNGEYLRGCVEQYQRAAIRIVQDEANYSFAEPGDRPYTIPIGGK